MGFKRRKTENQWSGNELVINAYEIHGTHNFAWDVAVYKARKTDKQNVDEQRGALKGHFWDLRRSHKDKCHGYGFIIDLGKDTVAIPQTWRIPDQTAYEGYDITRVEELRTDAQNADHELIVRGILRESIKRHFKNEDLHQVGPLWQHMNDFCEPPISDDSRFLYCKRLSASPERLRDGRWVLKVVVGTITVDGWSIYDYCAKGHGEQLAEMIKAKRSRMLTRDNRPPSVHVLVDQGPYSKYKMMDLHEPELLVHQLEPKPSHVYCKAYKKNPVRKPSQQVRLIVDSQSTSDQHYRSILGPQDRGDWYGKVRDFLHGASLGGPHLELSSDLFSANHFPTSQIVPQPIRVKSNKGETILPAPARFSASEIKKRGRMRARAINANGFLQATPINPLLAVPKKFPIQQAERLKSDLNDILKSQNLEIRFEELVLYRSVGDISSRVNSGGLDSAFVVLPEKSSVQYSDNDTHERVKKTLLIPSQCIHIDNILPSHWAKKSTDELRKKNSRLARRINDRYRMALGGLLVKHSWIPFAPAQPAKFNVHVGIDVGGPHNNKVMVCVGYGFSNPTQGLVFYPEEVYVPTQKAEPIPREYLKNGLITHFDNLYNHLAKAGVTLDFNNVLFFRDGEFKGKGDAWNEIDALEDLYDEAQKRGWVTDNAQWVAVEISKRAQQWRIFSAGLNIDNPIVGQVCQIFESDQEALVATTGAPYLTQGTAAPLKIRAQSITGSLDMQDVLQDLVWDADLCFTKVDMGMSLPWTLNVADRGALQSARMYKINGVTA